MPIRRPKVVLVESNQRWTFKGTAESAKPAQESELGLFFEWFVWMVPAIFAQLADALVPFGFDRFVLKEGQQPFCGQILHKIEASRAELGQPGSPSGDQRHGAKVGC